MTLQQLKYVIEIAECGSVNRAAQKLYLAQPSLSKAVSDLEKELGITIFCRSSKGVYLSEEGSKFLSYARQVVEQAQLLECHYKGGKSVKKVFAVSAQHYAFAVNAFVELVREYGENTYEFSLRESRTADIIEDVRTHRSEVGVIYLCDFNREVMLHILRGADLKFVPLFTAKPHVFVSRTNPLAGKKSVKLQDLLPYPRLTYDQGINNSFYYAEELHITADSPKNIIVSDRATLFNLVIGLNGYTVSSGIYSADLNGSNIVSVPLESDEYMQIGYIYSPDRPLGAVGISYVEKLKECIAKYKGE
ncbi:MAG: LysR family transcriptional regulator [Clostridia bacterium]|nr:LysR family transcriptional regulator [Clostridia bacterium]